MQPIQCMYRSGRTGVLRDLRSECCSNQRNAFLMPSKLEREGSVWSLQNYNIHSVTKSSQNYDIHNIHSMSYACCASWPISALSSGSSAWVPWDREATHRPTPARRDKQGETGISGGVFASGKILERCTFLITLKSFMSPVKFSSSPLTSLGNYSPLTLK